MDPQTLKYAKSDEWVHVDAGVATIGITDFAVKALTDLVYIDLPAPGKKVSAGQPFGVLGRLAFVPEYFARNSATSRACFPTTMFWGMIAPEKPPLRIA